jgi:ribose/xylose/arabinose/galactoside ABC-type transport system permease subunit
MNSSVARPWRTLEFKLLVAWLLVVLITMFADQNRSYLRYPGACAQEVLRQTILLGIVALGSAVIIISGGIDLASGSTIALSSTLFAGFMLVIDPTGFRDPAIPLSGGTVALAALGAMLGGALVGTFHAWLITRIGLPPFVATLSTLVGLRSMARGLAKLFSESGQINLNEVWVKELLTSPWTLVIIFTVLVLVFWILMSRTVWGRQLHALGGNETAALLSGIRTDRLKWLAYCLGSMCASLMGLLFLGETSAAKPESDALGFELNAIAAAVIGGCSLRGGIGTIPGTMLGCLFLSTVIDAIGRIIGTDSKVYEGLIVGIVVVFAVTFSQRSSQVKQYFSGALGWATIPFLGLLVGTVSMFFYRNLPVALALGAITVLAAIGRGIWEVRSSKLAG